MPVSENEPLECLPVIKFARLKINCDSCLVDWRVFRHRIKGFDEMVKLLKKFLSNMIEAPHNTVTMTFTHRSYGESWDCKVKSSMENGKRVLSFTEETYDHSKADRNVRTV